MPHPGNFNGYILNVDSDISSLTHLVLATIFSVSILQLSTAGELTTVPDPILMRFRATQNLIPDLHITRPMRESFLYPLLFAPGEGWEYGVGIDWAGWMVERVNGNISLQDYLEKNVYGPLGIKGITFFPKTKPATWAKMTDMSERSGGINSFGVAIDPEGAVEYTKDLIWNPEPNGTSAGAGGYGSIVEYFKILQSILLDDEKLLKKETVDEMFKPQLSEVSRNAYMEKLKIPEVNQGFGPLPLGCQVDWGLGGNLNMEDLPGRRKGSMAWSGYPNLHWFVDRVSGVAGIYGSQINPPGDLKTIELFGQWEKEFYKKSGTEKL
jgi:CubicO group peptidase (beta-lactamase class C family)